MAVSVARFVSRRDLRDGYRDRPRSDRWKGFTDREMVILADALSSALLTRPGCMTDEAKIPYRLYTDLARRTRRRIVNAELREAK